MQISQDINNYEKIKILIFILLVASLPFYLLISSVLIIAGVILSVMQIIPFKKVNKITPDPLSVVCICYFALELMGMVYTDKANTNTGFFHLQKHLGLVFIPFIFFDFKINSRYRAWLLRAFASGCFLACIICVTVNGYFSFFTEDTVSVWWRFSHELLAAPIGISPVYFALYLSFSG